jgi:hypothetical protein
MFVSAPVSEIDKAARRACLEDESDVEVTQLVSAFIHLFPRLFQKHLRISTLPPWVSVRKELPDVWERERAEDGVRNASMTSEQRNV